MKYSEKLKQLRVERGMSQEQLADALVYIVTMFISPKTNMLATILPLAGVVALPFAICLVYQGVFRKRTVTEGAR